MSSIMTKRGNYDNILTNEYICDTIEDLNKIKPTMGSVAIVIYGDSGLEVYMADGEKQWVNLGSTSIGNGEAASDLADTGQADSMILSV